MTRLIEVYNSMSGTNYRLREIYINPEHVAAMRHDDKVTSLLAEGSLPDGLAEGQIFTKLYIDRGHTGIDVTVVGDLQTVKEKLGLSKKMLLKG